MACEHEWQRYEGLPCGEDPLRYRQCKHCGVVGLIKHFGKPEDRNAKVLRCTVGSCTKDVTGRLYGRMSNGRLKWACSDHLEADAENRSLLG